MTDTIKMRRSEPVHEGGPTEADVHPAEVENWKLHGWQVAEETKAKPKAPKAPKPETEK